MTNKVPRIVVTRPELQGRAFSEMLCSKVSAVSSDQMVLEPLLEIKQRPFGHIDFDFEALIITSANALPTLSEMNKMAKISCPIFCVGKKTSEQIKAKVSNAIVHHFQNVQDMLAAIKADSVITRFLYVRGLQISMDIRGVLENDAKAVHEIICYDAKRVSAFSDLFIDQIKKEERMLLTFFSKRTALIFLELLSDYAETQGQKCVDLFKFDVLCISKPVLECFSTVINTNKGMISNTPDARGMVEAIEAYIR